jgi:hypothetical protein
VGEALAELPFIGPLVGLVLLPFGLVLLPVWCADSLGRDAVRTGRSIASIARWAFVWPFMLVLVLAVLTAVVVITGWFPGLLLWLVAPLGVGAIVATRASYLGGVGVGAAGLLAGGLLLGIVAWLAALVAWLLGSTSLTDPARALIYIPLVPFVVAILTAPQLGIGVLVVSVLNRVSLHAHVGSDPATAVGRTRAGQMDRDAGAGVALRTRPVAGSLAEEAAASLAAAEARNRTQGGVPPSWGSGQRGWAVLVGGALFGLLVTFAVYVPAGAPDAGEVTFAFCLFTILGGVGLGWALHHGRLAPAGKAFLGLGIGAAIGFVLVFVAPLGA